MVIAVEYGMLSNIWSIPHAKREVQYGLKNLQLFSFPIMEHFAVYRVSLDGVGIHCGADICCGCSIDNS